jgi:GAF domain-containing protein
MTALQHLYRESAEEFLDEPDRLLVMAELLASARPDSADLEQFTMGLAKVTGSNIAAVNLFLSDDVLVTGTHGRDGWFLQASIYDNDRTPCSTVVRTGRALVIGDLLREPQYRDCPMAVGNNIRSYVGAPLKTIHHELIGTVCLLDTEPDIFSDAHRTVLEHLARYAATQLRVGE